MRNIAASKSKTTLFVMGVLSVLTSTIVLAATCPPPPPPSTVKIDDTDPSIIYSTTWNYGGGPEDFMDDEHYSNFGFTPDFDVFGSSIVVNFDGTGITWIGKMGPNFGIASYSVDGGMRTSIDTYSSSPRTQNSNLVISGLPSGSHALKIEVALAKNPASGDYYQVIDGFVIQGSPLPSNSGTAAGYNSPALTYAGPWQCGSNSQDLSGGHCWANAASASVSWTFNGSLVEFYGRPDLENGIYNVQIDGSTVATIDGHFYNVDNDVLDSYAHFIGKVAPGTHTIRVTNTGTKDPDATNSYLQFDMFLSFP